MGSSGAPSGALPVALCICVPLPLGLLLIQALNLNSRISDKLLQTFLDITAPLRSLYLVFPGTQI